MGKSGAEMNTRQTAARLRAMARTLVLEAELLESLDAPEPKKTDWRSEFKRLKAVTKVRE